MKKMILFIVLIFSIFNYSSFSAVADHVVIAEIYPGGGNSGATYTSDYIVLYNPTGSLVDVSTWSVQYAGTNSSTYIKTNLVGIIPANSYYLIQLKSAANGIPLPYYSDLSNSAVALAKAGGKVALMSNQTLLTINPTVPDASVIDFVGYGDAELYEGSAAALTVGSSDTKSIRRKTDSGATNYNYGSDGSGWDTDDNFADFYIQTDLSYIPYQPLSLSPRANHVVIAEVYGGGGATGTYRYDYVVLYNSSATTYDLSTGSLQYYNGASWDVTNLSGTISPNAYYLIQLYDGGTGNPLPETPSVTGTTDIDVTNGEVAFVNSTTALTGSNPLSLSTTGSTIIDFIGYGSAVGYEGIVGAATSPGVTSSIRRQDNSGGTTYGSNGSGWDSNNNSGNFYSQADPVPLPVELTSFTVKVIGNSVKLDWKTETEVNNYGFEILRQAHTSTSLSLTGWEKIGFVNGNGNSNSQKSYSFSDQNANGSNKFAYRLKQIDNDGRYEYSNVVEVTLVPDEFALNQNYPNPFNPSTSIKYSVPQASLVTIKIYDVIGNEVQTLVNNKQDAGVYEVTFNAGNLASGMYFYKMQTDNFTQVKKMILIK
jgi:hypothetical protein